MGIALQPQQSSVRFLGLTVTDHCCIQEFLFSVLRVSSLYSVMGNLMCNGSLSTCADPSRRYPVRLVPIKLSVPWLVPRWIAPVLCFSPGSGTHPFPAPCRITHSLSFEMELSTSCFFVTDVLTSQTRQNRTLKSSKCLTNLQCWFNVIHATTVGHQHEG